MYGGGTSSDNPVGDWSQRCITLSNTVHSEIAPCLPLPSLPVFCGAVDQELCLFDDQPRRPLSNRGDLLAQAGRIAELLHETDVSYLDLKNDAKASHRGNVDGVEDLDLCCEVLRCNPNAFEYNLEGPCREQILSAVSESTPLRNSETVTNQVHRDYVEIHSQQRDSADPPSSSRKLKVKKKANQENLSSTVQDPAGHQDAVLKRFCEALEDFCGRAEVPSGDRDEAEWESMPISDIKILVNEIMSIRAEKMLHLTPVEILTRVLKVLDHQVHNAEGLSVDECQHSDSDVSLIFVALESIQAALTVMAQPDMPKQLYNEEIIERVLEFLRHQIMDAMSASDPSYRAMHKPKENTAADGDEDDDDVDFGSASKKRRVVRSVKAKRATTNRVSAASSAIYQKLCTILGFLRDLLLMERLSDSCILQLLKTSLSTFLVDNIQLLQLKAISLISGIFYSYPQHRSHIMDEVAQLLWKLPFSKRAARTYHLPDEEQKQIQMISALLLQMVHHSSNVPESLRKQLNNTAISEPRLDSDLLLKCHEATTETCVSFWTRVLQRFAAVKNQDASELKIIMDNLVADLLTTLNLPEYPASALLLEVLCVLLLQNAGPKSKDASIRAMAIELFGNIAARLKQDSALCNRENFWMIQELEKGDDSISSYPEDTCSVCSDVRVQRSLVACHDCQRLFHADCIGVRHHDTSNIAWNCPFCLSRKHLLLLQSYCKSQSKDNGKKSSESVPKMEIVQQMLLNYLQDAGSADDLHLFTRWFYLCLWCKDDPKSQQKLDYHLARLKLKAIVRDSEAASTLLTRSSIKKISAFLGQNSSFCRGFDRILCNLLACLRENSPVVRAKALRAVSLIVEADPDVLCDKRVQLAVEGRFCDSAISAREAALELVGRHIASHPDVGLKYFEKIAERVKDTGVSVRKRAIKIIRDMCVSNNNFPEVIRACIEIISRVSDEESSIQDLVCKTFYEFWFEEPSGVQTQFSVDGSSVPSELAKKTEQIVDMLRQIPNHQPLVTVIKRNLALDFFPQAVKAAGINPASLATVHKRCELICKCLLEKILQVQEISNMEGEATMLPYVMALYAFCTVDPKLCAPASDPSQFIVTLQPYLKNQVDNRVAAKLLESIIFIIDAVLPFLRRLPTSIVEELEQDLKSIIIRHSFLTVVSAGIKCVCTVGKQAGKGAALVELLIQLFFKRLDATSDDNKQVGRSLFCLGLLIRHGNSLLSAFNKVVDFGSSLSLFKKYLLAEDFAIKVRALQALGFVLIAKPECMLENDVGKIIAATLSSNSNVRLKMQSLQNIYEYLLDAESQLQPDGAESNVVDYPVEGGSTVPYAAGAGDTNICGGIVQLYWDKILERTLDTDEQVRQSALKIVEVVLRQGLVHPITCVPYLIALETDPEEMNSKLAHHLLMNMNDKHPDFFESRLGDGLQLSFFFIQSMKENVRYLSLRAQAKGGRQVKEKPEELSISNARLGVSRIYKLIRGNRVGRHKFMSSVVRKFDNPQWNETVIPFLMYCAEILALLPFTTPDEPLYLIYIINRVIQVRSGTLEASMKALSTYFSNRGSQKVLYENGCNQQDTTVHLTSAYNAMELGSNVISFHPNIEGQLLYSGLRVTDEGINRPNSGNPYILTEDDRHRIQAECVAAIAIQLLLKLKRHLKIVYNLDDVRCQAFSPTEVPKAGEALSKQSIPFSIGDMHTDLPSASPELTQRYQEYKNALREDTVDYSAYTANIKRKRPPARRGGRGGRSMPRDQDDDDDNDENWSRSAQRTVAEQIDAKGESIEKTRESRRGTTFWKEEKRNRENRLVTIGDYGSARASPGCCSQSCK
ncbi:hypothetical protein V2J09_017487 [Rumex salicifolius]